VKIDRLQILGVTFTEPVAAADRQFSPGVIHEYTVVELLARRMQLGRSKTAKVFGASLQADPFDVRIAKDEITVRIELLINSDGIDFGDVHFSTP
jgi:hypothetical protein